MEEIKKIIAELSSGEDERSEAAVQAVASHGAAALQPLRDLLASNESSEAQAVDVRWWAVRALAEITDPEVTSLLIYHLGDQDAGIRQCAALGLRKQPDPQALHTLVSALNDADPLVASLAGDALAAIGAPAVPALLEVLHDGPQNTRLEAVRALAKIGDHRSIPALFAALQEDSQLMEYWANEGLERMGVGMTFFKP